MSSSQRIIIAILALVTMLIRALPLAVFGMLVVYCLKDATWNDGIPEVAGIVAVVLAPPMVPTVVPFHGGEHRCVYGDDPSLS